MTLILHLPLIFLNTPFLITSKNCKLNSLILVSPSFNNSYHFPIHLILSLSSPLIFIFTSPTTTYVHSSMIFVLYLNYNQYSPFHFPISKISVYHTPPLFPLYSVHIVDQLSPVFLKLNLSPSTYHQPPPPPPFVMFPFS